LDSAEEREASELKEEIMADAGFTIAYSDRKGTYEIHNTGCRHIVMGGGRKNFGHSDLHVMYTDSERATAKEAKAHFESGNEDCFANIAPCAR
jgi:hypothetical protein